MYNSHEWLRGLEAPWSPEEPLVEEGGTCSAPGGFGGNDLRQSVTLTPCKRRLSLGNAASTG